jgi:hypothetical protein
MEPQIIPIGKKVALYSAVIGTLLLVSYLISKDNLLIKIGFTYILFAILINIFILLVLFIALFLHVAHWKNIVATIICVLLNIPLTIFYLTIIAH